MLMKHLTIFMFTWHVGSNIFWSSIELLSACKLTREYLKHFYTNGTFSKKNENLQSFYYLTCLLCPIQSPSCLRLYRSEKDALDTIRAYQSLLGPRNCDTTYSATASLHTYLDLLPSLQILLLLPKKQILCAYFRIPTNWVEEGDSCLKKNLIL